MQRAEDYGLLGVRRATAPPAQTMAMAERMVDRALDGIRDRVKESRERTVDKPSPAPERRRTKQLPRTLGVQERRPGYAATRTRRPRPAMGTGQLRDPAYAAQLRRPPAESRVMLQLAIDHLDHLRTQPLAEGSEPRC